MQSLNDLLVTFRIDVGVTIASSKLANPEIPELTDPKTGDSKLISQGL